MSESPQRKVLFVSTLYPSAFGMGSQIRGAAILRILAARHEVYLVVVDLFGQVTRPVDPSIEKACREIHVLKIADPPAHGGPNTRAVDAKARPAVPGGISRMAAERAILKLYQEHNIDLLFVFRLQSVYALATSLPRFPNRQLDLDELPSLAETKIHELRIRSGHPQSDAADTAKLEGLKRMEPLFVPKFQRVFVSSEIEIGRVREHTGVAYAELLPNICPDRPFLLYHPSENPQEILFVGNLGYFPNVDAVLYFCSEIYPLLRREKGAAVSFRVCGFKCPPSIEAWDGREGIVVNSDVKDLLPLYAQAALVVAPLRAGGGTRLKILEAFAHGRPVVSTSIGAEGLAVTSGNDILLADSPESFARACLDVLDGPVLAGKLIDGGLQLNKTCYSEEALARAYYDASGSEAEVSC